MRALFVLLAIATVAAVSVAALLGLGREARSGDPRDGILLKAIDSQFGLDQVRLVILANDEILADTSQMRQGDTLFVPFSFPESGWLQVRQLSPHAVNLSERVCWFPINESDRGGHWRIELREIAHLEKFGLFDAERRSRVMLSKVEPPDFGVMVTNKCDQEVKEVRIHHPHGDLVAEDLPTDWDKFVYWGVPMKEIEKLDVTVTMSNGEAKETGFTGLFGAPRGARWWPRRWEIVVVSSDGTIKR